MSKMPTPQQALSLLDQASAKAEMSREDHLKCQLSVDVLKQQLQLLDALSKGIVPQGTPPGIAAKIMQAHGAQSRAAASAPAPAGEPPPAEETPENLLTEDGKADGGNKS